MTTLPSSHPDTVRCFVAFSVEGPWPAWSLQKEVLAPSRHLTLAFLGSRPRQEVLQQAASWSPSLPATPLLLAQTWLRLPLDRPNLLALSTTLVTQGTQTRELRHQCQGVFGRPSPSGVGPKSEQREEEMGEWLPHVTVSRDPQTEPLLTALPLVCGELHLYESLPERVYQPIHTWHLPRAFEEFEHPADRAYRCRGSSWSELSLVLLWALAQEVPALVAYASQCHQIGSHAEAVATLNHILSKVDAEAAIPWKAVTFHGKVDQESSPWIWEVVIDV